MKINLKKINWWVVAILFIAVFGIFYLFYPIIKPQPPQETPKASTEEEVQEYSTTKDLYLYDFPLSIGNYWIYEGPIKWTEMNTGKILEKTITWKMEIVDIVSRGHIAGIKIKGFPADLDWYEEGLLPRDYIMIVYPYIGDFYLYAEDQYSQGLFRDVENGNDIDFDRLQEEDLLLDFSSVDVGKSFGCDDEVKTRSDHYYCWYVKKQVPINLKNILGNASIQNPKEYQIEFNTLPDSVIMGFTPGIGITRYSYRHHGTVAESDLKLTSYFMVRKSEYVEYVNKLVYWVLDREITENFEESLWSKYSNKNIGFNQFYNYGDDIDGYDQVKFPLWINVGDYKIKLIKGGLDEFDNEDTEIKIFKNDELIASAGSGSGKIIDIWNIDYGNYSHYFAQTWSGGAHCCYVVHPVNYGDGKIKMGEKMDFGDVSLNGEDKSNFFIKDNNLYLYFYNAVFAYFHSCFQCSQSMFFPDFLKFDKKSRQFINAKSDFKDLYKNILNEYIDQVKMLKQVIEDKDAKEKLGREWFQPLVNRFTYSLLSGVSKDLSATEFVEDYIIFDKVLSIDPDGWNVLVEAHSEQQSRESAETVRDEIVEMMGK